jgi:pilus assembly protein CpaF
MDEGLAPGVGGIVVSANFGRPAAVNRIAARLLESGIELSRQPLLRAAVQFAVEEDPLGGRASAAAAVDSLLGLGPLEPLLADEAIADILVNGPDEIWVERAGRLERTPIKFTDGASIAAAVERVIAPLGLRLDHASPVVDARLPDGSRLHAVLPPIAPDGPILAIRRFTNIVGSLDALNDLGALSAEGVECLRSAVVDRRNILVCGGTGTGKTTLLNVLSAEIPAGERVVTIEDAAELALIGHVVRLESRAANSEGAGAVSMQQLVRHGLRLRPDRIVIGEVRGAEAIDMIQAMATGHAGSMSTVHARDAAEALWRLELLAGGGDTGLATDAIHALVRSGLDLVVVMGRAGTSRVVRQIVEVEDDRLEVIG